MLAPSSKQRSEANASGQPFLDVEFTYPRSTIGEIEAFHDSPRAKNISSIGTTSVPTEGVVQQPKTAMAAASQYCNPRNLTLFTSTDDLTSAHTGARGSESTYLLPERESCGLEGSPVSFRVTCCTNRSSCATDDNAVHAVQDVAEACKCDACSGVTSTNLSEGSYGKSQDEVYEFPFAKGQRLKVLHPALMRLYEDKHMAGNPTVGCLMEDEYAYFLKAGKNQERLKVQAACGTVGWVTWRHESGIQVFAIDAQNV